MRGEQPPILTFIVCFRDRASQDSKLESVFGKWKDQESVLMPSHRRRDVIHQHKSWVHSTYDHSEKEWEIQVFAELKKVLPLFER